MISLMWATGAMVLVLIFVFLLPLGITKKGKVTVVLLSFLLALGGLAAGASFSLWQTLLMLFALTALTAYIIDSRLGALLFIVKVNDSLGNKLVEKDEPLLDYNKVEENEIFQLSNAEVAVAYSEEKVSISTGLFYNQLDTEITEDTKEEESSEIIEDDISFLLNRSIEMDEVSSNEVTEHDSGYLSEIESLLLDPTEELAHKNEATSFDPSAVLDVEEEIHVITFDDTKMMNIDQNETRKVNPLDELEEIPLLSFQEKSTERKEESQDK